LGSRADRLLTKGWKHAGFRLETRFQPFLLRQAIMDETFDPAQRRAATRFILATVFVFAAGYGIIMPVIPDLVMTLGHVTLPEATRIGGWLAVTYALFQFVLNPVMGNLGDRFGRRPLFLIALGGFAIDYALMGFAPTLAWLFIGRAIAGGFGAVFGPAYAALADMSADKDRAKSFGLVGAAFGIGFIAGPAIGGLLGELGPRAPFFAAGGLAAVNFVYGWFAFPETLPAARRRPFEWRRANPVGALLSLRKVHGVLAIAVVQFFWIVSNLVYPSIWAYFAIARFGLSTAMVWLSLAWSGTLMALAQAFVIGRAVDRFGERGAALIGMLSAISVCIAYALVEVGWLIFVVMLLGSLQSLVGPSLVAMMSRRVAGNMQGELQGFNGSIMALGSIAAPLAYNPLLAYFTGPSAPFHFTGAPFALAAAMALMALTILQMTPKVTPEASQ